MTTDGLNRRHALTGAAVIGVGVPLLAACGGSDTTATDASSPTEEATTVAPAGKSGEVLGSTADVEVGGGAIYTEQKVVVTQPSEGEFKAFSSICTHQGCPVASVADGAIKCPCHGSTFSVEDGSVSGGPAPRPLPAVEITVEGDQITLA